jgi:hypothetical protein
MNCIGLKGQALADCKAGIKFTLLAQARSAANRANKVDSRTPATKQDSINYRDGYKMGQNKQNPSSTTHPYGEGGYHKMGRWEGKNKK